MEEKYKLKRINESYKLNPYGQMVLTYEHSYLLKSERTKLSPSIFI